MNDISIGVAILAGIAGIVLGIIGASRTGKKDVASDVAAFTRVQVTLEGLSRKVDKIDTSLTDFTHGINALDRRVGALEVQVKDLTNALERVKSPRKKAIDDVSN